MTQNFRCRTLGKFRPYRRCRCTVSYHWTIRGQAINDYAGWSFPTLLTAGNPITNYQYTIQIKNYVAFLVGHYKGTITKPNPHLHSAKVHLSNSLPIATSFVGDVDNNYWRFQSQDPLKAYLRWWQLFVHWYWYTESKFNQWHAPRFIICIVVKQINITLTIDHWSPGKLTGHAYYISRKLDIVVVLDLCLIWLELDQTHRATKTDECTATLLVGQYSQIYISHKMVHVSCLSYSYWLETPQRNPAFQLPDSSPIIMDYIFTHSDKWHWMMLLTFAPEKRVYRPCSQPLSL